MKPATWFLLGLTLALSVILIDRWNPTLQQHEVVKKASGLTDSPQASQPTFAAEEKPLEPGLAEALSKARHQVRELTAEEVKLPGDRQARLRSKSWSAVDRTVFPHGGEDSVSEMRGRLTTHAGNRRSDSSTLI